MSRLLPIQRQGTHQVERGVGAELRGAQRQRPEQQLSRRRILEIRRVLKQRSERTLVRLRSHSIDGRPLRHGRLAIENRLETLRDQPQDVVREREAVVRRRAAMVHRFQPRHPAGPRQEAAPFVVLAELLPHHDAAALADVLRVVDVSEQREDVQQDSFAVLLEESFEAGELMFGQLGRLDHGHGSRRLP